MGVTGYGGGPTGITLNSGALKMLWGGDRGIINNYYKSSTIEYFAIPTTGNASSFGTGIDNAKYANSALSNTTRALFAGGNHGGNSTSEVIDYITVSTTGNSTDFGNMLDDCHWYAGICNGTRGVWGVGNTTNNDLTQMSYVTVDTTGNATDFGNTTVGRYAGAGAADATRGVFAGGYGPNYSNVIDYITIDTTGDGTDFGDLAESKYYISGASDATRAVWCGGAHTYNSAHDSVETIEYSEIQTAANASDFGDLIWYSQNCGTSSNGDRAVHMQSRTSQNTGSLTHDEMCYFTIQTTGNASDFGDTVQDTNYCAACSGE